MDSRDFIGRQPELVDLNALLQKKTASLVVVKGRRRIGKSRLIDEFSNKKRVYKFVGLAPNKKITAQSQRDEFALTLSKLTGLPEMILDDWGKLFTLLARETKTGRVVIIFDEISWMGSEDPTFLPKLKTAWDEEFKNNPKLMMFFCGSVSTWIDENILSSTGFYGRISWEMTLGALPLTDCNQFLEMQGFKGSAYEKFKVLSITGGIPWYLEQIKGSYTADDNIKQQCFTEAGILVKEFDRIFKEIFTSRDVMYKKIVKVLVQGSCEYEKLALKSGYKSSGRFSSYLSDLVKAGFITRDYTWRLKSGEESRISHFRLSDNYLRFYLKYIQPKRKFIEKGRYKDVAISTLPGWNSMMSLQFENLVLNNRDKIIELLNLRPEDIVADNPFIQSATRQQAGCQVDYLIQTKYKNLYVVEVKFSQNTIGSKAIKEVQSKINRLVKPREMAVIPVLIHVNGVSESVLEADYFYRIIDFREMLNE